MCNYKIRSQRIKSLQDKAIECFSRLITSLILEQLASKNIHNLREIKTEVLMISSLGRLEMQ